MLVRCLSVLALVVVLGACSSGVTIHTDYLEGTDFSHIKTFTWYEDIYPPPKSEFDGMNTLDERMRDAVEKSLRAAGLRKNSVDRGDILLHYQVSAKNKQSAAFNDYYNQPRVGGSVMTGTHGSAASVGFNTGKGVSGSVASGTHGSAVSIGISTGAGKPRSYREGTIVIDVIDREKSELIWRGYAEGKLPNDMGLNERNKIIREVVPKILEDFPP